MLSGMKTTTRTLILGASALFAFGTLTACSSGSEAPSESTAAETTAAATATATAEAGAFPESAKYIADMQMADGRTMTIGIAVDGDQVAAYACDGSTDEAWFFGNTTGDGTIIDITGKFEDTLDATFDGTDAEGTLVMNGESLEFTAAPVDAPAGMYTAELNGVRSSWVVRPDDTAVGVTNRGDRNQALENAQQEGIENLNSVRERRLARMLGQADPLEMPEATSMIDGQPVTAEIVNGDTRLG